MRRPVNRNPAEARGRATARPVSGTQTPRSVCHSNVRHLIFTSISFARSASGTGTGGEADFLRAS